MPSNYLEVIESVRNDPSTILKVKEYSDKFNEIKDMITKSISKSQIEEYYDSKYTGDSVIDLSNFLRSSKEEQKEKYKNAYSESVLDTLLAKTYSVDEYIKMRKEIEVFEMRDAILRNDYDAFIAIGDIIDAIFFGKYRNGVLLDEGGKSVGRAYGHGIGYYRNLSSGFDEMIANYGSILKSPHSKEILAYLRYIVGDQVVDMIEDCYQNRILNSTKYINEEEKSHGK